MSDYSFEDLQSMQQKAMERVNAMKKHADALISGDNQEAKQVNMEHTNEKPIYETKITSMSADIPKKREYEDFKTYFKGEKVHSPIENMEKSDGLTSILKEKDRPFLLGILDILKEKDADNKLILSLVYILS